jgi:hypothetical protein
MAETKRWDDLSARSGLTSPELVWIRVSLALGAVHAALRHAASAGLDIENVFPLLARPGLSASPLISQQFYTAESGGG